ncbi:hypothetical protein [Dyella mobilis]|uniref:Uncharacterized protein n=1 Tax=Dyella mobilis TaxID=1849582 RepID=A0ABS2KLP2_9GAMM|nr:hypothetical protein [Dyella mobilis]MBM7131860.1 hypothetical protein [Dyella mobilis]
MQVAVAASAEQAASDTAVPKLFSFAWLEARLEELAKGADEPVTTRLERYAMAAAVIIGGAAILVALLLRNQVGVSILRVGIIADWICVALIYASSGYRAWRYLKRQHREFAIDLDNLYPQYRSLIDKFREFPATELGNQLRYVRDRKATFLYRYGLIIGSTEKLGVLPLLAVLYLQLKDWSFNGWADALNHIHLVGGLLLWMLLLMYLLAWWGMRTKGRLDLYEMLLTEASEAGGGV